MIMTGLSTVPFDLFEGPITAETERIAADRATLARHALDLLESTTGQPQDSGSVRPAPAP
jgi:hypothetical protein